MEPRSSTEKNPLEKNILPGQEAREFSRVVKQAHLHLDELGREILDGTPVAPPVGYKQTIPLAQQIREMVRSEHLRIAAEKSGMETFEEADDFDVGDDYDPSSPYELIFEGLPADAPPPAPPSPQVTGGEDGQRSEPPASPPKALDEEKTTT